jgi:predicted porin
MKKKAIALAVGALCIAPVAQAQTQWGNDTIGTVQFYGKLYPQVTYGTSSGESEAGEVNATLVAGDATGDTAGGGVSVDSNNTYLGFRGQRKFGGSGLAAIWQVEQAIDLDFQGEDATFSNRNSFLGLTGGFGTVKLGNMDTIYKEFGAVVGMFGITSGNYVSTSDILSRNAANGNGAGSFHVRAANSIQYLSPEFSGFQFGAQYSPDETKNDIGNTLNAELWSFGVKYEAGPLYVSLQHELHKDFFGGTDNTAFDGTSTGSKDRAWRLSATYKLGNHTLAGDISQIEYTESGGVFDNYKRVSWDVGIESKWGGPWRTGLEYVRSHEGSCEISGVDCDTDGLDGQMFAAGVAYDLDRNTFLYAIAAKLINGDSAIYNNFARDVDVGRGADITQFSLGMSYRF